jgi:hypothetical protein
MDIANIVTLMKQVVNIQKERARLAGIIVNMIRADVPESPASLSLKIASLAGLIDVAEEIDPADPLREILQEDIEACFTFLGNVPQISHMNLREDIAEMRAEAAERVNRMKAGEDILKGLNGLGDISLN